MRFDGQMALEKDPRWLAVVVALLLWGLLSGAYCAVTNPMAPVVGFDEQTGVATVSWDANDEPDLAGYKVYWGLTSRDVPPGSYSDSQDVGNVTAFEVLALIRGETYYFAVTAYDTAANESGFSDEAAFTIPFAPDKRPHAPVEFVINGVEARGDTIVVKPDNGIVATWSDEPMYADSTELDPELLTEWRIYIDSIEGEPENRTATFSKEDNEIEIELQRGLYKIYMSALLQEAESDFSQSRIFEFEVFEKVAHTLTLRILKVQP